MSTLVNNRSVKTQITDKIIEELKINYQCIDFLSIESERVYLIICLFGNPTQNDIRLED